MTGRRPTYAEASKALLRNSLLDALHDLLNDRDWSAITMTHVATAAGVSRQTVYNEFRSRYGLAQAYALRIAGAFATHVGVAIEAHVNDIHAALYAGFNDFFTLSAQDPMIRSLLAGDANSDLLKLLTTDAAPLITAASDILAASFTSSWLALSDTDAIRIARAIARMALSYVAMPPEGDRDVAEDLATVMGPAITAVHQDNSTVD
ncbi:putative TetR family transcriptional regulator [Gordonia effusa NBRC 100432]|uniref:Putative TetR family transcriptional regulator n=1 Tax=Gordonia effusa NBRC 100432 TaxID=1077974 RepID=H0QVB5_9ACTN|nr:TetR/AcrR family transcriptional regulator [Gordonia effusa]GAB16766.1 putative TetR family transcriptional regulator [Gordonia effusa NBRC 100432]